MSGRLRGCMQACLEALAQSQDAEVAAVASRALALQDASTAAPLASARLEAGSEYLTLIEILAQRGAFSTYDESDESAALPLTSVPLRRL